MAIVVIQPLKACHYLSIFNVYVYISLFEKYVWLPKQTCHTLVNLVRKKIYDEKSMQKYIEKYEKHSKCGLIFVLHLIKHDENAKYLYKFRKLDKIRTACISYVLF